MTLTDIVKKSWNRTKTNFIEKRYLQNYPNDVITGVLSRTPTYVFVDSLFLGVPNAKVMHSQLKTLEYCIFGWSAFYNIGQSVMVTSLGDFYNKHKGILDAAYSSTLTFGFGMSVNLAGGYSMKQALMASGLRATVGLVLGTPTSYYTDAVRDVRNEPITGSHTFSYKKFLNKILRKEVFTVPVPIIDHIEEKTIGVDTPIVETTGATNVYELKPTVGKTDSAKPRFVHTNFKNKSLWYSIPRLAAMIGIPLAIIYGSLKLNPDKVEQNVKPPIEYHTIQSTPSSK